MVCFLSTASFKNDTDVIMRAVTVEEVYSSTDVVNELKFFDAKCCGYYYGWEKGCLRN